LKNHAIHLYIAPQRTFGRRYRFTDCAAIDGNRRRSSMDGCEQETLAIRITKI
jgi:hypothetical protein